MVSSRFALYVTLLTAATGCQRSEEPSAPPTPAATRDGRWQQDITYVCDNVIRLHPDAFHFGSQEEFEAARDELLEQVPELSDATINVRLAAVIALLNDAHTKVLIQGRRFPALPFEVGRFSDGFLLIAVPAEHEDFLGGTITHVSDVPIDEAVQRIGTVLSHESDVTVRRDARWWLRVPAVLKELGLSSRTDAVHLGVDTHDGIQTVEFEFAPEEEPLVRVERESIPIPAQHEERHYWYQQVPQHQAVYVAHNKCYDDEAYTFEDLAAEVLKELENPDIKRLIIDLRRNQGGGEPVAYPLIKKLPGHRLDRPGGIIVLIGDYTFSSGQGNALTLRESTQSVLIGEPTGQLINHFGEVKLFQSPNYKLVVQYSTNYFEKDPEEDGTLTPDIEVHTSFDDWKQGIDPAFEAALAYD